MTRARSILFSAPMVRALLDGCKTQTRRVINSVGLDDRVFQFEDGSFHQSASDGTHMSECPCPYGVAGDLLWVKESWRTHVEHDGLKPSEVPLGSDIQYVADNPLSPWLSKLRVSIFMPRWASRLTLRITDVRAQRLWSISEEDARAEGVYPAAVYGGSAKSWLPTENDRDVFYDNPKTAFQALWNNINGDREGPSWDDNPWVWALTFSVLHENVETVMRGEAA